MATNYPGSLDTSTQQPSPSSTTEMDDAGFEHDVVHTNHSGAIIALETKVGTGDSNAVANSVLAGTGSGTSAWTTGALANDISGNAATATELETARTINGTSFNGTANITVTAAADTLTGSTLNSGVTASSLTSVGTLTSLTTSGNITTDGDVTGTSNTNFYVKNDSGEEILFQESSNQLYFKTNGTWRAYFTSGGDFVPYADSSYDLGTSSVRWAQTHSDYFRGANGSSGAPTYSWSSDSNTGMYRVSNGVIGMSCNGTLHQFKTDGLHLASGDWFRAYGSAGIYWQTYGGGWNMSDTSWIRAYGSKGIVIPGGIVATLSSTTSTSGHYYVMRNTTYGTLSQYTSSREFKDNITNVTASDAAAWIDSLQPVTFVSKWMSEEEEPEDARAWREADVQVGFIAEDVLANSTSSQFAQVKNVDGTLKGAGWKWECVIAAAVAEIKSLRARVADLEAA